MNEVQAAPESTGARSIVAIVLAAGSSTRFGSQKLVAEFGGLPLIRRTVIGILQTRVDRVRVVIGADASEVRAALVGLDTDFTYNAEHAEGMATSIAAGVHSVADRAAAVVIAMGDQPLAKGELVDALIDAYSMGPHSIVVPDFDGVLGPPVLFGRTMFGPLQALTGDVGARSVIEAHPAEVRVLAMGPAPPDVDTLADRSQFEEEP